ncbi:MULTISPECIES: hypothetical protein [unclassified Neisseria]|uniref:hypothetical protein n=1 Tax=unclassified Neisseria TaxID=2623750 RepID=UPI0010725A10|nr:MULTISPECIES: hypothetical protein [unclassified Neisseria]MBF0802929.1 hypothetical protein [Neisseria sp. 19428wB4_WF04]TFU44458.1 hypothetical protein E4T99_00855 [Neisseria sp. WF04]
MVQEVEILDAEPEKSGGNMALHSTEVMQLWANGEAYDEKIFIERGKLKFREAQEAFFEFGRVLVVLKEHMPHGKFQETVQQEFNIAPQSARKMIQATVKFCSPQMLKAQPKLLALGKSKLFELMTEDDEDLQQLADGGSVNGLTLDDVDRMTIKELRVALRESRDTAAAKDKVIADKNKKVDELAEKLAKKQVKEPQPHDVAGELTMRLSTTEIGVRSDMSRLRDLFEQMLAHGEAHGFDHRPQMVGCINQIIRDAQALREQFMLPEEAPTDETPEWLQGVVEGVEGGE